MDDQAPPPVADLAEDAASRSLSDDLRQLAADGRTYVEAELAWQKSRLVVAGAGARGIAGWGTLALALVFFALMALVVGSLIALAPLLGGWGATALVTLILIALAALSAWAALSRWRRMQRLLAAEDKPA